MFAGNFAPRTWAFCNGQLLSIAQNTALFSILGTTYGGNGTTNFALPDLRGRVPVGTSQGPGLTDKQLGEVSGVETVTLISTQIPSHTHSLLAGGSPTTADPTGATLPVGQSRIYGSGPVSAAMSAASVGTAGGNQPHTNMQPYLGMNYIICLQGIFPSRN